VFEHRHYGEETGFTISTDFTLSRQILPRRRIVKLKDDFSFQLLLWGINCEYLVASMYLASVSFFLWIQ